MVAGGGDAAGIEAAISARALCWPGFAVVASIAGGPLGADALRPVSGTAAASTTNDGAGSCGVALLACANLGLGSLGSLGGAGVVGAAGTDDAVSFGAALVAGMGTGGVTAGISICGASRLASPEFAGAAVSAAGGGPNGADVACNGFAAPFLAGAAACCAG